ncbi:MAG: VOC family protein [Pseudobdellovibrionaceae bacterium]
MEIAFTSITVNTPNLENMIRFYEILGCQFSKVKVDIGGEIFRSRLDGVELSLMSIKSVQKSEISKVMMGFKVNNFESKLKLLALVPGTLLILDPSDMPDGRKAIIQDPDGHSIEIMAEI